MKTGQVRYKSTQDLIAEFTHLCDKHELGVRALFKPPLGEVVTALPKNGEYQLTTWFHREGFVSVYVYTPGEPVWKKAGGLKTLSHGGWAIDEKVEMPLWRCVGRSVLADLEEFIARVARERHNNNRLKNGQAVG